MMVPLMCIIFAGNPFDKGTIMATGNNMEIEVEMPAPTNRDRAELHFGHRQDMFPHSQHWLWIVVGVAVVAVLVLFIAVKRWKHLQTTGKGFDFWKRFPLDRSIVTLRS